MKGHVKGNRLVADLKCGEPGCGAKGNSKTIASVLLPGGKRGYRCREHRPPLHENGRLVAEMRNARGRMSTW